jgi:hypothetical protein
MQQYCALQQYSHFGCLGYNLSMSDADELAQRYLALWSQYLTALLADPAAMETLKRWVTFTQQFSYPAPGSVPRNEAPFPAWPPFFGPFGIPSVPPGATGDLMGRVAELTQRVDELERRLAEFERQPRQPGPRRRARTGGR